MKVRLVRLPLLCALLLTTRLSAQADSARKDSTARAALAPVIVTASREPLRLDRMGLSASELSARDLAGEPARNVADALRRLGDVYLDANAGPNGPTSIRIRGADETFTKVLMDGVEVNVSGGPFRAQGMTLGNTDRVELVRGPQSALHGSNAMAGVVQIFTAEGAPGPARWALDMQGGAADVHGSHGGGSFAVTGGSDALRYSAGGGVTYEEGIYDVKNRLWNREASTRLDASLSSALTLTGTMRYSHMESHLPVRNPGATRVPLDSNQRDENEFEVAGLSARWTPSPSWTHTLRLGVFHDVFSYADLLDSVPPHPAIPYFNGDAYTSTDLVRTTLTYDATTHFSGSAFTIGGALERESTGDTVGGDFGNGFTPERRDHGTLFSELNASLRPAVAVLGGVRVETYQGLGWAAAPRFSARFNLVPDRLALRVAVGRGFKAPNIEQQFTANAFIVPNPDLKPETSWSGEAGLTYRVSNGPEVSATYFQQRFYGLIQVVPAAAPETRLISQNLGTTDANGVEMALRWVLPSGVAAEANVSVVHTAMVDNAGLAPAQFPIDSALPSRPFVLAGGALDVPMGRLRMVARATAVGRDIVLSEIFSGSRQTIDPYGLVGVTVNYDVARGLALYARGENLLNTTYLVGFDRPGESRTWTLGMRVTN
ncbi:MAG TPA: TonB-dependent receptor [Gemmatimonadales bacterium]